MVPSSTRDSSVRCPRLHAACLSFIVSVEVTPEVEPEPILQPVPALRRRAPPGSLSSEPTTPHRRCRSQSSRCPGSPRVPVEEGLSEHQEPAVVSSVHGSPYDGTHTGRPRHASFWERALPLLSKAPALCRFRGNGGTSCSSGQKPWLSLSSY